MLVFILYVCIHKLQTYASISLPFQVLEKQKKNWLHVFIHFLHVQVKVCYFRLQKNKAKQTHVEMISMSFFVDSSMLLFVFIKKVWTCTTLFLLFQDDEVIEATIYPVCCVIFIDSKQLDAHLKLVHDGEFYTLVFCWIVCLMCNWNYNIWFFAKTSCETPFSWDPEEHSLPSGDWWQKCLPDTPKSST